MKRWARAPRLMFCGYCKSRAIQQGDPILFINTPWMKRELRRCVDCAGPAPPDLPPLPVMKAPGDFSMTSVGALKPKTRGALKATARERLPYREPGQEG